MSRSIKKHPWVTDHRVKNPYKKAANKKIRTNLFNIPNKGSSFKRYFQSYDICDYKFFITKKEAIARYEEALRNQDYWFLKRYPTLEDWLSHWRKCYLNK